MVRSQSRSAVVSLVAVLLCCQPTSGHNHHHHQGHHDDYDGRRGGASMKMIMCINASHFSQLEVINASNFSNGSHHGMYYQNVSGKMENRTAIIGNWTGSNLSLWRNMSRLLDHGNLTRYGNLTVIGERVIQRIEGMEDPCRMSFCNATCNDSSCLPALCNASKQHERRGRDDDDDDDGDDDDEDEDADEDLVSSDNSIHTRASAVLLALCFGKLLA